MKDLNHRDLEAADKLSWKAICNWPLFSDIKTEHDGLDYSLLISRFLWDKVGRAVRRKIDPEQFEFESGFQELQPVPQESTNEGVKSGIHAFYSKGKACYDFYKFLHLKLHSSLRNGHVLYVPINSLRLKSIIPE